MKTTGTVSRRGVLIGSATSLVAAAHASPSPPPAKPANVRLDGSALRYESGGRRVVVRFTAPGVVSVTQDAITDAPLDEGFFSGEAAAPQSVQMETDGPRIVARGPGITVSLDRETGRLTFSPPDGEARLSEVAPEAPIAGVAITSVTRFATGTDQRLHGLGQFREPAFDYNGRQIFLAHANSDAVNPFLVSSGGWGVFWDTGTAAYLRSTDGHVAFQSIAGDLVRYHVVIGDGHDALIAGYRSLTGRAALLGRWAYGYWQSKERYASQAELTGVVDEFRRRRLPLDGMVLDWRYWGETEKFSGMTFDAATFPDPEAMTAHVHACNARIIVSVWPAFGPETEVFREMEAAGHLFPKTHWGGGRVFDATAPDARAIYWKHVNSGLMARGFDGLWTDGCEPEFLSTGNRYVTAQSFAANGACHAGPIVRNLLTFSYHQSGGLSAAMRKAYPDRRPLMLTRSTYPGQQAFGAVTWSGDIFASWGTLRNQVIAAINTSFSGNPWWNCDIGAFLVSHRFPDGLNNPAYRELYVRWFQFGAFLPMFRAHGTEIPREPWRFGESGDPVFDAIEGALRLRYALMPYLYASAARVAFDHDSLIRPLAMDFPDDKDACDQTAQYLFGRDLMVRIVDRPLEHAGDHPYEFLPNESIAATDAPAAHIDFYEGADFERPVASALTDDIKLSWSGDLPEALRGKPYSVRYTGSIRATETGLHRFRVTVQGSVRLTLAGKLRVDSVGGESTATTANGGVSAQVSAADRDHDFEIEMIAGTAYPFILEQRQPTPDAVSLWFEWLTPSQAKLAVPDGSGSIPVLLPSGTDWYEFDTGTRHEGGKATAFKAPVGRIPLFARAGAIIPMTPGIEHSGERTLPSEIRVFAGSDGAFSLYDDSGDGHGHLDGEYLRIAMKWDDANRSLMLDAAEGAYPGGSPVFDADVLLFDGDQAPLKMRLRYDGSAQRLSFAHATG